MFNLNVHHTADINLNKKTIVISRTKSPLLKISYCPHNKEIKIIEVDEQAKMKLEALIKKATSWADDNIAF